MEPNPKKTDRPPLDKRALISLSFELGYIIALPLIIFGLIGKWLDGRAGNSFPVFTLLGVGLAIVSTTVWLFKRLKKYM
jgi:hypothetical protein